HNVVWDINGNTWCAHGFGFCTGVYSNGGWGFGFYTADAEDWKIDHNTFVGLRGQSGNPLWFAEGMTEGIDFTNNFLYIAGTGFLNGGVDPGSNTCGTQSGTSSQCAGAGTYCRNFSGSQALACSVTNPV